MSEQEIKECIRAFAMGYSPENVADFRGISVSEATAVSEEYQKEISAKKLALREEGKDEQYS